MTGREKKLVVIGVPLMAAFIAGAWYLKQRGSAGMEDYSSAVTPVASRPVSPIGVPPPSAGNPGSPMGMGTVTGRPDVSSMPQRSDMASQSASAGMGVQSPFGASPRPKSSVETSTVHRSTPSASSREPFSEFIQPVGADVLNPVPPQASQPVFKMIDPLAQQNTNIRRMKRAVKELELQKQVAGLEAEVAKASQEKKTAEQSVVQADAEGTNLPKVVMIYQGTVRTAVVRFEPAAAVYIWQEGKTYDGFFVKSVQSMGVQVVEGNKTEHFLPVEPMASDQKGTVR